jgi:hypothetical protein
MRCPYRLVCPPYKAASPKWGYSVNQKDCILCTGCKYSYEKSPDWMGVVTTACLMSKTWDGRFDKTHCSCGPAPKDGKVKLCYEPNNYGKET